MKNNAYLPVGKTDDYKTVLINRGDIIKLVTGETVTFIEMKRTKFIAKLDGRELNVPVWRNRQQTTPFISELTKNVDKTVMLKTVAPTSLSIGDLFSCEGSKETFMFAGENLKRRKSGITGIDLATRKRWNIDSSVNLMPIDLTRIEHKLKETI